VTAETTIVAANCPRRRIRYYPTTPSIRRGWPDHEHILLVEGKLNLI
jgi:hypothetical protein